MLEYLKEESTGLDIFHYVYGVGCSVKGIGDFKGDFVVLPRSVDGVPLKAISKFAFRGIYCIAVYIPETIGGIGEGAFQYSQSTVLYCEAKSVPDGWNENWNYSKCPVVWDCKNNDVATDGCIYTYLDGIVYSLKDGEATVFNQSYSIKDAKIPPYVPYKGRDYKVTAIKSYAFSGCNQLSRVEIPATVEKIDNGAFFNCHALREGGVHITSLEKWCAIDFGVNSEESNPLYHAKNLYVNGSPAVNLTIPEGVKSIKSAAFKGCTSIMEVTLPESLSYIGSTAFKNCNSLVSINIPEGVTEIGYYAFEHCKSLTIYCNGKQIPGGWDEHWNGNDVSGRCPVVWDCKNNELADDGSIYTIVGGLRYRINSGIATLTAQPSLTEVADIPESIEYNGSFYKVTGMDDNAFAYLYNLKSVIIPKSISEISGMAFYNCSALESVVLPKTIKRIGYSAFCRCTILKEIRIPKNVEIEQYAFSECDKLQVILK